MVALLNCRALFLAGASMGATLAQWSTLGPTTLGLLAGCLIIAVATTTNLHRLVARSRNSVVAQGSAV